MMMNKEEAIDKIIEHYKEHKSKDTPGLYDCCQKINDCAECPFYQERQGCRDAIIYELAKRLIGGEGCQETNFDRYIKNYCLIACDDEVTFKLGDGWKESFCNSGIGIDSFREWLLSPYNETPRPKYKLTRFEYDLLSSCRNSTYYYIKNFWTLKGMVDKGYFKNIPTDVPIKEILSNCEVADND